MGIKINKHVIKNKVWIWYCLKVFFPELWRENVAFVAEPDEVTGVLRHVPYHLEEEHRVLGNSLTKGQTLSTHMEPKDKTENNKRHKREYTETSPVDLDIYILR